MFDPYASARLTLDILGLTALLLAVGVAAAVVLLTVAERRRQRRARHLADLFAPYGRRKPTTPDPSWLEQFEASLKAHREASERRQR